jgi:hypothetical protein
MLCASYSFLARHERAKRVDGGASGTSFKLFEPQNSDLFIKAERLRGLTNSLFSVISILKNPPENPWQFVM